jgi:23S rRNA maturation-related 3'-5' exoribonuclease YhaM
METQSFVLGVLATYGVTMTAFVIIGMVKISRLVKQQKSLEDYISNTRLEMDSRENEIRRIISETNREITMVERTIMQRIDNEIENTHRQLQNEVQFIHKHEDEIEKELNRKISDAFSYTDSRIDKVVLSGSLKSVKKTSV